MASTMIVCAVYGGLFAVSLTLWTVCLSIGLRWTKVATATRRRVAVAVGLTFAIDAAVRIAMVSFAELRFADLLGPIWMPVNWGLSGLILPLVVVAMCFRTCSVVHSAHAYRPWPQPV